MIDQTRRYVKSDLNPSVTRKIKRDLKQLINMKKINELGGRLGQEWQSSPGVDVMNLDIWSNSEFADSFDRLSDGDQNLVLSHAALVSNYKPKKQDIEHLAISGGGGKGQFYVGALRAMENEGILDQIKCISGTSAGALAAIPLALGMTPSDIYEIMENNDFRTFMIEGRAFNSVEKRKEKTSDLRAWHQASNKDTAKITLIINRLKFMLDQNALQMKQSADYTESEDGSISVTISRLFEQDLEKPVHVKLDDSNFSEIFNQLSQDPHLRDYCSLMTSSINKATNSVVFSHPKEMLKLGVSFLLKMDYVEYYFGKMVHEQIREFVSQYGVEPLASVNSRLRFPGNWSKMTLSDLGKLANTPEGQDFGIKNLAIGVTETRLKGGEGLLLSADRQLRNTKGLMVSSELAHTDSLELSNVPISQLARMSMSIPFEFNQYKHGDKFYVDGGLHHNLPTEYFDRRAVGGHDKKLLSILPLTKREITHSKSVEDALSSSGPFSPSEQAVFESWKPSASTIAAIWAEIKHHLSDTMVKRIMLSNNKSYSNMSEKDWFRTIIVNCGEYETLSLKAFDNDQEELNRDSYLSFSGFSGLHSWAPVTDPSYSSLLRLFETKCYLGLKYHQSEFMKAMSEVDNNLSIGSAPEEFLRSIRYDENYFDLT